MKIAGKVAVVTGGASGIGAALVTSLHEAGARGVVVADLNVDLASEVAQQVGGVAVQCDVTAPDSVQALTDATLSHFGAIDLFCANAGIGPGTDPFTTDLAVWQSIWEVNVMSHVHAVRSVLPAMLERGSGHFLHTASISGLLTSHGMAPYATTKHALVGLVEWLAVTYGHRGIGFSCLCPLGVRTPMIDTLPPQMASVAGPFSEPADVARLALEGIASKELFIYSDPRAASWVTRKFADPNSWIRVMQGIQASTFDSMGSL